MRRQSPVISIADSMSAFMRELRAPVAGAHGQQSEFQRTLNRLAFTRLQIVWAGDDNRRSRSDRFVLCANSTISACFVGGASSVSSAGHRLAGPMAMQMTLKEQTL